MMLFAFGSRALKIFQILNAESISSIHLGSGGFLVRQILISFQSAGPKNLTDPPPTHYTTPHPHFVAISGRKTPKSWDFP